MKRHNQSLKPTASSMVTRVPQKARIPYCVGGLALRYAH
jgi:hypothetical protein